MRSYCHFTVYFINNLKACVTCGEVYYFLGVVGVLGSCPVSQTVLTRRPERVSRVSHHNVDCNRRVTPIKRPLHIILYNLSEKIHSLSEVMRSGI